MLEENIFIAALDKADSIERAAYLDLACGGDTALRARVEALIQSHEGAGSFLAQPVLQEDATGAFDGDAAPAAAERSFVESAGTCIGPYKLLQKIGEGGMGVVWMAQQQEPVRRKVAVKVIKAGMDSAQVVARFEAERQALALMDHPNIAKVLDAGATGAGRPYFVMELVKGVPITKYCDEHQLTPRQRLELFVPVCQAIQHAHQKGIIHRDLKPSNVFVASYDGKPVPKVIDFGVAKAMGQQLTERTLFTGFGGIVGTLEYMSPEQAEFNALDVDTRSDVYSLGVLLYELLTGTTPLTRQKLKETALTEVLRLIREEEPPKPSTRLSDSKETLKSIAAQRKLEPTCLAREVRGELDWIVMKALEKDRGRRYDTATGLARDIERYLADETVEACPPSARYRLYKFVRKHRHLLGTAAAFTILLVAGMVLSLSLAVLAAEARDSEIDARRQVETQRDRAIAAEKLAQQRLNELTVEKQRADKEAAGATAAEKLAKQRLNEVTAEKQRADQESAIARAVNDFLQFDLLGQADAARQTPDDEQGRDPDVKARTLLDRAAKAIDRRFKNQPLTEAAIRQTVGNTYLALGKFSEAQPHLDRSAKLLAEHRGAEHRDTLTARNSLAALFKMQGKEKQAEALYQEVIQACTARLPDDDPLTLSAKHNLTRLYRSQGHYDRAETLCTEVLKARSAQLGADHPDTLSSKHTLAMILHVKGKNALADASYKEVLQALTARFGADHPKVLNVKCDIAWLYKSRGNNAKAEELYQEVLKSYSAVKGAEHPFTLSTQNNLALVWNAQRKHDRAEALLTQTLQTQRATLGENHPDTLTTKGNLASVYQAQRKYDRAEELFKEALEASTAKLGAEHISTLVRKNNLAGLYYVQGKYDQAEPLFRDVLEKEKANLGTEHPRTLITTNNLAGTYYGQGKFTQAEPLFAQTLKVQRAKYGTDHGATQLLMSNLAGAYVAQGKNEQAEPLLRELLAIRKAKDGPESDTVADLLSKLGPCILKLEKYAEAESILRDCLKLRAKKQPDAWFNFNTQSQIGAALLGQQKYAEAEPLLLKAYEGMKKREATIPANRKFYLTEAVDRLVQLYDAWGNEDKAAAWRKIQEARKKALP